MGDVNDHSVELDPGWVSGSLTPHSVEVNIDIFQVVFRLVWLGRVGQVQVVGGHVKYPAMLLP